MNVREIKRVLVQHKPVLAERFKVRKLGVFGSFVRGEQNDRSDVDVLVEFSEPVGFFTFINLEEYLQGLLGHKVDLVTRKALKPHIGRNILRELVTV